MKNRSPFFLLASLALSAALIGCSPSGDDDSARNSTANGRSATVSDADVAQTIAISANDEMKFNVEEFEVRAGQTVRLTLNNIGSMPKMSMGHNVVILKQGADATAFVEAAMSAAGNDYIPQDLSGMVVAHTKMLGGGESDSIVFQVPSEPGDYVFICSFPGHYQVGMRGQMVVR